MESDCLLCHDTRCLTTTGQGWTVAFSLAREEREETARRVHHLQPDCPGVITATRGTHGQSVAFAAARAGFHAVVVVLHGNSVEKNAAMRALGAELIGHTGTHREMAT